MNAIQPSRCLFNVHTPTYSLKYHRELESQRAYATRHAYAYHSVALDHAAEQERGFAKWHKVQCFIDFLDLYDIVLMLDCDCLVRESAPDIATELVPGKSVYIARGYSGRFNSGVILAHKSIEAQSFFRELLGSRHKKLQPEDVVSPEGENGHLIELANSPKYNSFIQELDYKWNNNSRPEQPDYIRHFSGGPMKQHFKAGAKGPDRTGGT